MKIDFGFNVKHENSNDEVALPVLTDDYYEIFKTTGRADFLSGIFRFNADEVLFKVEIDGNVVFNVELKEIKDILGFKKQEHEPRYPIRYNESKKSVIIDFGSPIQLISGIRFLAKSNSNSRKRKLTAYSAIFVNGADS